MQEATGYQLLVTGAAFGICSITDLRLRRISGSVLRIYLAFLLVGRIAAGLESGTLMETMISLAAGILPGVGCLLLSWFSRQALGYGDSLLILLCGMSLGARSCLGVLLTAFFLAGLGALVILWRRRDRKEELPFAPFLLAGFLVWLVCGA